MTTHPRRECCS